MNPYGGLYDMLFVSHGNMARLEEAALVFWYQWEIGLSMLHKNMRP